ncbi:MAG: PKD domain-containing protein [Pseudomonadota bacterium]
MKTRVLQKNGMQKFIFIFVLTGLLIFSGCSDRPEHSEENTTEPGRIALSISWRTQSADSSDIQNPDGTLNCESSEVATIYAAVYDSDNQFLGDSGSQGWDCHMHSGVIEGIEAGEGRRVIILAKNQNGDVVFRGEQTNITVTAGQTVKPEPVEAFIFSPELTNPKSNSTVTNGAFTFQWLRASGASAYEISISLTIDFSDIIESDTVPSETYDPEGLDFGFVYYWRVRAIDSHGNAGAWSNISSFYVEESRNTSPILNPIGPKAINEGEVLEFTVTASDPDNDSLSYSVSSLPSGAAFDVSTQKFTWTPSYFQAGQYTNVKFVVTDNGAPNISASEAITITVHNINRTPVANAGPDQSGVHGQTITLDGSESSDVDEETLTYAWEFTSRPAHSSATLSSTTAVKPSFTIDRSGDYTVRLIVNDGTVNSTPDTVNISTNNSAPVANAGPDQAGVHGQTITLDGSGSSDVDGDSLTYSWAFTSRPAHSSATLSSTTAVNPNFTIDRSGDYTVRLTVNDGTVNSAPDTVNISTNNSAPVANAGPDQAGVHGQTITLNGGGSSDVDGDPLTYSWAFTSRPVGSTAALSSPTAINPSFTIDVSGDYTVQLIVNDGTANSTPDTVNISTNNSAPVANAGPDQAGVHGQTITLNGGGSSDVDGDPLTYSWAFTSRPAGSTATLSSLTAVNPNFTIDKSGDYTVRLTVNDGTVNSVPDTVNISTNNSAPVANAGTDQAGVHGQTITLNGSGSSDVDGDPLTYSWAFTSRPAGSTATLSSPTAVNPNFTIDVSGDYTVRLTVNDGTVNSAPDTVSISTNNSAPVANAGSDQSGANGELITLNGSGSSDVDGDPLTYSWAFTSRPAGSTATLSSSTAVNPSFSIDVSGDYTLQLIVSDGAVNSTPDTVTISTENSAPEADAGTDQTVIVSDTVTLDGSGSEDADWDPLTYAWSFSSRPFGSGAELLNSTTVSPTFTADVVGSYVVQLIVNDGSVNSTPVSVTITAN